MMILKPKRIIFGNTLDLDQIFLRDGQTLIDLDKTFWGINGLLLVWSLSQNRQLLLAANLCAELNQRPHQFLKMQENILFRCHPVNWA
jgi:hypothetical protein